MDKFEAIEDLLSHDHGFLYPDHAQEIGDAFGVKIKTQWRQDQRSVPKGLCLWDGKEGDWAEGVDAHSVAEQICNALNLEYRYFFGIGSQLRGCCEVLMNHFNIGPNEFDENELTYAERNVK